MDVATAGPHRVLDDSFLRFLPAVIREPRRAWLAIPTAFLLSLGGSILLAAASRGLAPQLETPNMDQLRGASGLFALAVFAPFLETLIMGGLLSLFLRFMKPAHAVMLSSLGWGVAHSLEAASWGLVIWWPFLIFSTLYVTWRQRGFWIAVLVVTATHALQNVGPAITVAYPHLAPAL